MYSATSWQMCISVNNWARVFNFPTWLAHIYENIVWKFHSISSPFALQSGFAVRPLRSLQENTFRPSSIIPSAGTLSVQVGEEHWLGSQGRTTRKNPVDWHRAMGMTILRWRWSWKMSLPPCLCSRSLLSRCTILLEDPRCVTVMGSRTRKQCVLKNMLAVLFLVDFDAWLGENDGSFDGHSGPYHDTSHGLGSISSCFLFGLDFFWNDSLISLILTVLGLSNSKQLLILEDCFKVKIVARPGD